jgi:nucleotide-binding universal stress UspA family protein
MFLKSLDAPTKPRKVTMYGKILVPVDGSEHSERAVAHAVSLAEKFDAEVVILNVAQPIPLAPETTFFADELRDKMMAAGRKLVTAYKQKFQTAKVNIKTDNAGGMPADVICEKAENENFDLVVIGSRGLSAGKRIILGSVSGRVSRNCPCPVLIVR